MARLIPTDEAVFAGEFFCIGGEGVLLRGARGFVVLDELDGLGESGRGGGGEAVVEGAAGLMTAEVKAEGEQDIAGIEALVHVHDGDAGLGIAGEDGGLYGGRAAMTGEDGGVEVDTGDTGGVEDGFW